MTLTAGHWAASGGEVVIDQGTADSEGFEVGERVGVAAIGPVRHFTIIGDREVRLGPLPGRRDDRRLHRRRGAAPARQEGRVDLIFVAARHGRQPERGRRTDQAGAAAGTEVRTGTEQAEENAEDVNEFLQIIRYFLLAFAGIARPGRRLRHLQHHLDHGRPEDRGSSPRCGRSAPREGRCCARC